MVMHLVYIFSSLNLNIKRRILVLKRFFIIEKIEVVEMTPCKPYIFLHDVYILRMLNYSNLCLYVGILVDMLVPLFIWVLGVVKGERESKEQKRGQKQKTVLLNNTLNVSSKNLLFIL